MGVDE
jgi:hypothetical protein